MRQTTLSTVGVFIAVLGFGLPVLQGGDSQRGVDLRLANLASQRPDDETTDSPTPEVVAPVIAPPQPELKTPMEPAAPPRDPTEPGEALRDMVAPFRMGQPGRPGAAGLALPRIALKGRIIGPNAPPAAIVELQGSLYMLYEESELTVDGPEAAFGGLTLRTKQITSSEVRIEVLPLGKVMVLR